MLTPLETTQKNPTKEEIAIELSTAKDWKILSIEKREKTLLKQNLKKEEVIEE